MRTYYAQINEDSVCMALLDSGGRPVDEPHMIPIETLDTDLIGKTWHPETSTWSD